MKINLLINNATGILNGYENVDLFADKDDGRILSDYSNLHFCSPNEALEIRADNIIQFFEISKVEKMVDHWVSRLRHGGKLTVLSVDSYSIALAFSRFEITPQDFNKLTFGQQKTPWDCHKSSSTIHSLATLLASKGLEIVSKKMSGYNYCLIAERK